VTHPARKMTPKRVKNLSQSMTSTGTGANEPEGDSINQNPFEDSGCFKGGYASINAAPYAGTAVVDATGGCEMMANSIFEAAVAPDDGVAKDLDPKSGLCRLSAEQLAYVQTDKFEPTSKSAEVDHEGALRSFRFGQEFIYSWRRTEREWENERNGNRDA